MIYGGDEIRKKEFWDLLDKLKSSAIDTKGDWNGNYYYCTTYTMKDGSQYMYMEDMEYGIPYSIEKVNKL